MTWDVKFHGRSTMTVFAEDWYTAIAWSILLLNARRDELDVRPHLDILL